MGGVWIFILIFWVGKIFSDSFLFTMSAMTYRALKKQKSNQNRQGDDIALVSPSKGRRSSSRFRLCLVVPTVVCFENRILR